MGQLPGVSSGRVILLVICSLKITYGKYFNSFYFRTHLKKKKSYASVTYRRCEASALTFQFCTASNGVSSSRYLKRINKEKCKTSIYELHKNVQSPQDFIFFLAEGNSCFTPLPRCESLSGENLQRLLVCERRIQNGHDEGKIWTF